LVTLIGMLLIGSWVNERIVESVTRNSAVTTALYMESFITPLTQDLTPTDTIAPATAARLDTLFQEPHFAARIAMVKIWKAGGLIIYSTLPEIVGRTLKSNTQLRDAWAGRLSAECDAEGSAEDLLERAAGLPLLEVYNPIHSTRTGEVIAVAEFYQIAGELKADLLAARMMSWAVVGTICLLMFRLLFGIVSRGARTIERQRAELERRLAQVARMSEQNAAPHRRIQGASRRGSELNERHLRRISAELHDGPAQALAHASLRLDSLFRRATGGGPEPEPEPEVIRSSLGDAMREIREICRGLSLPHIEGKPLGDVIAMVAGAQSRRSGADIAVDMPPPRGGGR
jgi:signal transduction histidine kinase